MLTAIDMDNSRLPRSGRSGSRAAQRGLRAALRLFPVAVLGFLMAHAAPKPATGDRGVWPQWRGPLATGVSPDANPPVEWSEERNVRWKLALPGKGHSTPIVWGDRVFLTAAVP